MSNNPIQQVYDHLLAKSAERAARHTANPRAPRFRPSEVGGCWREIYYRFEGREPRPISGETQLLFLDGEVHHNVVRQLMREAGVELRDLVFTDDGDVEETGSSVRTLTHELGGKTYEIQLSGRTDGSIPVGDKIPILEIKTLSRFKFDEFQRVFAKGGEKAVLKLLKDDVVKRAGAKPHPAHANRRIWYQFQATMLLADQPAIFIVLKNRDRGILGLADAEGVHHGLLIEADPEVQTDVLSRCAVVLKALETGTPPSQEFSDGSMSCNMCGFYQYCWGSLKKGAK